MGRVAGPHVPDENDRELLRMLHGGGEISGEEISERLHMTRAAVWKRVQRLRSLGYSIESAPRRGYWLAGDVLRPDDILAQLHTRWLGRTLVCQDVVDSTFHLARDLEAAGAPNGAVAVAGQQTAGRGRLNRAWASPPDAGLYFNILLRPKLPPVQAVRLTPAVAVGVCEGLRGMGFDARIKWPNDIVIGARKVCGMLLEMGGDMERLRFVSAGIGINVSQGAEDFPEELRDRATSLAQETDRRLSRTEVLCVVLESAERAIDLCYADYGALLENYRARSATLGARVRATSATGEASITGVATDINENGELIVQDDAGAPHVLRAGDVSIRGMMGYV